MKTNQIKIFLNSLKCYGNFTISFNGACEAKSTDELIERIESELTEEEINILIGHIDKNEVAEAMVFLTISSTDFYFNSEEA